MTARRRTCEPGERSADLPTRPRSADPVALEEPALFDTAVWTWTRDRRFPRLAEWFNEQTHAGLVLVCDLVILELLRLVPNEARARQTAERLAIFEAVPMERSLWSRAREVQLLLAAQGQHRRVPPADLMIAATAEAAGVKVIHYDHDYERIAKVTGLSHRWFVAPGSLA